MTRGHRQGRLRHGGRGLTALVAVSAAGLFAASGSVADGPARSLIGVPLVTRGDGTYLAVDVQVADAQPSDAVRACVVLPARRGRWCGAALTTGWQDWWQATVPVGAGDARDLYATVTVAPDLSADEPGAPSTWSGWSRVDPMSVMG